MLHQFRKPIIYIYIYLFLVIKVMFLRFLLISTLIVLSVNCQSLKQLHIFFRHGERAPLRSYPNDPHKDYKWSRGWDNLSNMYQLGQIIRCEYKNFIPKYYWYKDVNVSSSYADRCKMSAEALCAGLFTPEGEQIWTSELLWQPVPISYAPRKDDILIAMKAACPKYDKMFEEVMQSKKVKDIEKANKDVMDYLSEHTGQKVDTIGIVETLYNTLQIEQINNLTLPSWVNETILSKMRQLGAQNLALYSETEYMKRMKGGTFLRYVFTVMEKSLAGIKVPILHLYGGHDINLVHILRSLDAVDTIKPEFGAYMVFELYTDGSVKINYRNSWDTPISDTDWNLGPKQLTELLKIFEPVLPNNWSEECKLSS